MHCRVITALSAYIEAQGSTSLAAKRSARRIDHRSTPWYEAHGSDVTGVKDENLPESTPAPEGNDGTGTANGGASSAALTELLESLTSMMEERDVTTPEQARTALRDMAAALLQAGPMHAGVHDVVVLLASTEVLLSQTQYESFSSALSNVSISGRIILDIATHACDPIVRASAHIVLIVLIVLST